MIEDPGSCRRPIAGAIVVALVHVVRLVGGGMMLGVVLSLLPGCFLARPPVPVELVQEPVTLPGG